ncbi:hypothetical protein ASF58_07075 [Methylobacterium sp. Leaf125]|nr:hypothetical protein ASF58_07075 [Methylobacterium sp. Leaf125]
MDTGDIESRLREAQAAFLKRSMAINLLDRCSTSPDVTRARRTQETAEASLAVIVRQVTETKNLLDRGIVSRNEYDGLVQQRDSQRNTATGAGSTFRPRWNAAAPATAASPTSNCRTPRPASPTSRLRPMAPSCAHPSRGSSPALPFRRKGPNRLLRSMPVRD